VQRRGVPAPFLQPVHMRVERRGEAFPVFGVEDSRIFLHAGQDFVLCEHRVANELLADAVAFVVVKAQFPQERGIDQLCDLGLERAQTWAPRWRVGARNAQEDGRRRLATLPSRRESRQRRFELLLEYPPNGDRIAQVLPESSNHLPGSLRPLARRLLVAYPDSDVDAEHDDDEIDRDREPVVRPDMCVEAAEAQNGACFNGLPKWGRER